VTLAPTTRAGAPAWNKGSMRTIPVNHSLGPLFDACVPILLISMVSPFVGYWVSRRFKRSVDEKLPSFPSCT
jgi:hypothetical protein